MDAEIIMLGTGSAFPQKSYNTCFAVRTPEMLLLADAGGGNGIFAALRAAGIEVAELRHMFVSHAHTDHIFGAVWIIRAVIKLALDGKYDGRLCIYANAPTAAALREICRLTLLESHFAMLPQLTDFVILEAGMEFRIGDTSLRALDAGSENVAQSGLMMTFPSGRRLATLGDEALTHKNMEAVAGADWLMCGAFCRHADKDIFKPYEKHHHTVRDVARLARDARIGTLLLYHSEDRTPYKEEAYRAEAAAYFSGRVVVPSDGCRYRIGEDN